MMNGNSVWARAQTAEIRVAEEIKPGFDIGFDKKIPERVRSELRVFVEWMESSYRLPVTFWVDFEYRHYLIREDGKRVGFLFFWSDFDHYPAFSDRADIPELRLAVRDEHWTTEEILMSVIEGIMCYYAWICNEIDDAFEPDEAEVEEILREYLRFRRTGEETGTGI